MTNPQSATYHSHYDWLNTNLDAFWVKVTGKTLDQSHCAGIVGAHGDKCYGYKHNWAKAGIPFEQGVAIYLLSYVTPHSKTVRSTDGGWVDPAVWVVEHFKLLEPMLPPAYTTPEGCLQ